MSTSPEATFAGNYERHLQHLKLKGLQPKTIEAYSRAIRRIGERFDHRIDALSETADERGQDILGALYDWAETVVPEQ